ncbi:MAG: hypothetical protein JXX28_02325 [Deltaproteobacteria bacterium]|nr:hypothetical protein [Deltaproteobacteria bacterium]
MGIRFVLSASVALLLTGCGRDTTQAEVKMVGVGMNPESVGPEPEAVGGVVEYNHVRFAGGGLPLGFLGLAAYEPAGPALIGFAPPYDAVMGFSYVFDRKLRVSHMSSVAPMGPAAVDTCFTLVEPSGPIGSFTTVDVGDWMSFKTEDGRGLSMTRMPTDYPPDPQGMFVYYFGVESYMPETKYHLVPDETNPDDPRAMKQAVWRGQNYPFGEKVTWSFPGGFSNFEEPVGSIPLPSHAIEEPVAQLPQEIGGVMMQWTGARYDGNGNVIDTGPQSRCFEFADRDAGVEDDGVPLALTDCDTPAPGPRTASEYDSFEGQIYTAPWDTEDGLTLRWTPKADNTDTVNVMVRFLSPIDREDPGLSKAVMTYGDGETRPATACEGDEAEWAFDYDAYGAKDENGALILDENGEPQLHAGMQGDPNSRMAEVVCTLADDGEFNLNADMFAEALQYVDGRQVDPGGVIFFFSRTQSTHVVIPDAKDQYNQRHEISPVSIQASASRIGRFHWNPAQD